MIHSVRIEDGNYDEMEAFPEQIGSIVFFVEEESH